MCPRIRAFAQHVFLVSDPLATCPILFCSVADDEVEVRDENQDTLSASVFFFFLFFSSAITEPAIMRTYTLLFVDCLNGLRASQIFSKPQLPSFVLGFNHDGEPFYFWRVSFLFSFFCLGAVLFVGALKDNQQQTNTCWSPKKTLLLVDFSKSRWPKDVRGWAPG